MNVFLVYLPVRVCRAMVYDTVSLMEPDGMLRRVIAILNDAVFSAVSHGLVLHDRVEVTAPANGGARAHLNASSDSVMLGASCGGRCDGRRPSLTAPSQKLCRSELSCSFLLPLRIAAHANLSQNETYTQLQFYRGLIEGGLRAIGLKLTVSDARMKQTTTHSFEAAFIVEYMV